VLMACLANASRFSHWRRYLAMLASVFPRLGKEALCDPLMSRI
jgi:hypothetical protein